MLIVKALQNKRSNSLRFDNGGAASTYYLIDMVEFEVLENEK